MFCLKGEFIRRADTVAERDLERLDDQLKTLTAHRNVAARLVQTERITRELQERTVAKKTFDEKKHAPHVESVIAAMDAAGTDPRARITAALKTMSANSAGLNPHELREAVDHAASHMVQVIAYAYNEKE